MPRPSLRIFRLPTNRARRKRLYIMFLALLILLTFLTPFYVIYKPPNLLIRYFARRWPDVLWHVPEEALGPAPEEEEGAGDGERGRGRGRGKREKVIALTIDDAPSSHTSDILSVLSDNQAHATFFLIGSQIPGREDMLKNIVQQGNQLANHAMHDEPSRSLKPATLTAELNQVQSYISATYALLNQPGPPRYFRPGSGFFSSRMREVVRELGYTIVLGSVYPHDAQISYAGVNARHILSMVKPGAIVICHDRRSWTAPMLRVVLPELKRRGYRVTTVSGLLEAAARNGNR